jgi:putative FmdB family regulatory protein
MPTYRYECDRCGAVHEEFQSISDPPRAKCPECGGKLTRLIGSGGGVILKGSGFYTTDYRSESYHSAAKKEKEAAAPKGDAAEGKKEGKKDAGGKKPEVRPDPGGGRKGKPKGD